MTSFLIRLRRGDVGAAAIIVAAGILISRFLGIIRDMVFAAMLGSSGVTDEYVAAFRIPDYANYLLAGGFLTITFIPIFARYLAEDDEAEGWRGFTAIFRWLTIGITTVIIVAWFLTPTIIRWLYPEFTEEQITSTIALTRVILPAQFAFVVGAMFSSVQYAKGVFTIPTLAPIVYNLGIIAGGITWALATGDPAPDGFVWGALVGAFAGNFALQAWGARRVGLRFDLTAQWLHPSVRAYIVIALPLMIGQSIVALDEVFMSVFGGLVGEGAQTDLQYARRTMFVPIGVIGQAVAVAAYPTLARLFAEGNRAQLLRTVDRALRWVIVLSIGAAGAMAALALPIIRVLYERGAFTGEDTDSVSAALFVYAFGIPVWGALQIITRAFYAKREMWTPVLVGTAITLVAIPSYFSMQDRFGIQGIAATSVVMLGVYTATLCTIWYWPTDARSGLASVMSSAGRAIPLAVPAALISSAVAWAIATGIAGAPAISALIALLVGAAVYGAVTLGIGSLLYEWLSTRVDRRPSPWTRPSPRTRRTPRR
ncbi:MAG: murein biosynthesis integral membrane protein MurJ [Acidimicrobiia bacterium]